MGLDKNPQRDTCVNGPKYAHCASSWAECPVVVCGRHARRQDDGV